MVRKLKFHEQKLLKKVDFISWECDHNLHEMQMIRKFSLKNREEYTIYNKLAREIRELSRLISQLNPKDSIRNDASTQLIDKLYSMGLIPTKHGLHLCANINASAICRRRLPSLMVKNHMAENMSVAAKFVEHGHVRVGPEVVMDPAFLVCRNLEDFITWTNSSAIRKHVLEYNDMRDDFEFGI